MTNTFYSQKFLTDISHRYYSQMLLTVFTHRYNSQMLLTDFTHRFHSQILRTDITPRFYSTDITHRKYSQIILTDSKQNNQIRVLVAAASCHNNVAATQELLAICTFSITHCISKSTDKFASNSSNWSTFGEFDA